MLPCFRLTTHEADTELDTPRGRRNSQLSPPRGKHVPVHIVHNEEPFSNPQSPLSSSPMSPASPPPGKRRKEWEDTTLDIQHRALLAMEDGEGTSVLKELLTSEERLLNLLAWSDRHDGEKILHVIARSGNNEALKLLLAQPLLSETHGNNARRAAFLNATNQVQETPLLVALGSGNYSTAALILQAGADPWLQNYNRESAFYMACYCGAIEVVTRVLQMKSCSLASVRAASGDGLSGLDAAKARGHTDVVQAILEYLNERRK